MTFFRLTEADVEQAALTWLESLGWNVAPDTPAAEGAVDWRHLMES